MNAFSEAVMVSEQVQKLMEGVEIPVESDSDKGTLTIGKYVVHTQQDPNPQHVTLGSAITYSCTSPAEAVIEAVVMMIGDRARDILREALLTQ